jgi:CRP-like cAMP-binding protein
MAAVINQLIEGLPAKDRLRLLAQCESFHLMAGDVLYEPGETTRYAYFPTTAFIALLTRIDAHPGSAVGMVGHEGLLGAHLAFGVANAPLRALVQGTGLAWRMRSAAFRQQLSLSPSLRRCLSRYLYVLMTQFAASAACMRFHMIGPRLARWLLMSQDRANADTFYTTHESLAYMLGVRRVGVTTAAGALQRAGLISYHRGEVMILNRQGLAAASCSCYAADRQAYADLL